MSETVRLTLETDSFNEGLEAVRQELQSLVENDLNPLAEQAERVFSGVGQSITDNLTNAASKGSLSIKGLVNDILTDLSRLAAEQFVRKPLEGALEGIFGGARAGGGLVMPGMSYLVGERGPELFTPQGAGTVSPSGSAPLTVNISMPAAPQGDALGRSQTQLAGQIGRALRKAARNA